MFTSLILSLSLLLLSSFWKYKCNSLVYAVLTMMDSVINLLSQAGCCYSCCYCYHWCNNDVVAIDIDDDIIFVIVYGVVVVVLIAEEVV